MGDFINFLFKCDRRIDSDNDHVIDDRASFPSQSPSIVVRRRRRLVTATVGTRTLVSGWRHGAAAIETTPTLLRS